MSALNYGKILISRVAARDWMDGWHIDVQSLTMHGSNSSNIDARRKFVIASAFLHTSPPKNQIYANCAKVLQHALMAADLWGKELAEAASAVFTGDREALAKFPVVTEWYSTLIELTQRQPESERLLEGGGNLDLPAGAFFTGCWLTPAGQSVAETLLAENPSWREKLR